MKTILSILMLLALPAFGGRDFVAASSQFGVCTIPSLSPPITLAAWAWALQNSVAGLLIGLNASDNGDERVQVYFNVGNRWGVTAVNSSGTSASAQDESGAGVTNRYQHAAGVFSSSTLRAVYVDGLLRATNTTSISVTDVSLASVAARKGAGTWGGFWTGDIAEAAVWDVALTSSEILSLSLGCSPFLIRPANLKFYAPLTGRETASEWNLVGSSVSLTNSPAASANHPRIYRP